LALFQVVVGSQDLAANHDVMQIVEVWIHTFGFGYFFLDIINLSFGFTLLPLQVLDDRSRDERLLTLLQKYHSSKRYSLFFIHTNAFLNLVLWSFILI